MKFRAERSEFADAVAWAQRTVGDRTTLPAMAGIKAALAGDRLSLASTNIEMDSEVSITVQGERDGTALVSGRLLSEVVRALPNDAVTADASNDALRLACGRAKFDLRLMAVEDFPSLRAAERAGTAMKADDFARAVAQVARASSNDDARPVLTGVSLEARDGKLTATATDSYRLAIRSLPWEDGAEASALVPRRALELARHAAEQLGSELRVGFEAAQATFEFADRRLVTRLIEGKYPEVRQLIPNGWERRLSVDRAELAQVVKRIAVLSELGSGSLTPVTFELDGDTLVVRATSTEAGEAEEALQVEFEGEPLTIAFNPRFLADGLDVTGGEQIVLEFRDELKPAVIRPTDGEGTPSPDFLYLLMPIRV